VSRSLGKVNQAFQITHELGLKTPPVLRMGPWKLEDACWAVTAVIIIYDREKQNAELANFSILRYEPPKSIT
jgi:hypothetical protein